MARLIFWNRRSGYDRRILSHDNGYDRRYFDRRKQTHNGYLLLVGSRGIDGFNLFFTFPLFVMVLAMMGYRFLI